MPSRFLALAAIASILACSVTPAAEVAPADAGVTPQNGGECSLRSGGLKFEVAACDTCMQEKCCAPTVACFSGDEGCGELHACLTECPQDVDNFFIPIGGSPGRGDGGGGGNGTGGGDGGGGGGGGNGTGGGNGNGTGGGNGGGPSSCRDACKSQHPAAVSAQAAHDECIRTKCMPACAQ